MRLSMVLSLFIAALLAALAVVAARNWLATERLLLTNEITAPQTREEAPKRTIIVAAEEISFGERLIPSKLRAIDWASDLLPAGSFQTIPEIVADSSDDAARFALTSISAGEPILVTKITEPGVRAKLSTALTPGMKAISIRVNDVLGVAGFVLPGDRVDVLITRNQDDGSYVDVLLQGVKVLAIDQISDDRKDQPSVVRTVTFEVNTQEAQKLVLGANVGTLSLALRNLASTDVERFERITLQDLSDPDAADDLLEQTPEPEPVVAPVVMADPQDDRLLDLERLLRDVSDGISDRLDDVERRMNEPEPEPEKVVVPEVKPVRTILPQKTTIGVIRNGRRDEYKVNPSEEVRVSGSDDNGLTEADKIVETTE